MTFTNLLSHQHLHNLRIHPLTKVSACFNVASNFVIKWKQKLALFMQLKLSVCKLRSKLFSLPLISKLSISFSRKERMDPSRLARKKVASCDVCTVGPKSSITVDRMCAFRWLRRLKWSLNIVFARHRRTRRQHYQSTKLECRQLVMMIFLL
jgi:hypothetical protein